MMCWGQLLVISNFEKVHFLGFYQQSQGWINCIFMIYGTCGMGGICGTSHAQPCSGRDIVGEGGSGWEIGIISKNEFANSRVANHLEIMWENTHEDSFRKLLLIFVFCLDWSFKILFDLIKSLSEISNCLYTC